MPRICASRASYCCIADRNGFIYVLDRVTGELLLAKPGWPRRSTTKRSFFWLALFTICPNCVRAVRAETTLVMRLECISHEATAVMVNGGSSNIAAVPVATAAPGLFVLASGQAAVLNPDYSD